MAVTHALKVVPENAKFKVIIIPFKPNRTGFSGQNLKLEIRNIVVTLTNYLEK